jgi:hypothetical protein
MFHVHVHSLPDTVYSDVDTVVSRVSNLKMYIEMHVGLNVV